MKNSASSSDKQYENILSDYVVIGYRIDMSSSTFCAPCRRSNVRNIYIVESVISGATLELGKCCAGNYTGQFVLIEAMEKMINRLINKRKRFESHKSWKCSFARNSKRIINGKPYYPDVITLKYDGTKVLITENKFGNYILFINRNLIKNTYYNSNKEAKLGFFRIYGKDKMTRLINKYYKYGQENY